MSTLATSGSQRLTDTVTPGCSQLIGGTNGGARGATHVLYETQARRSLLSDLRVFYGGQLRAG